MPDRPDPSGSDHPDPPPTEGLWAHQPDPDGEYNAVGNPADAEAPAPLKVCPSCSIQEKTLGRFCPHCGDSYARHGKRRKAILSRKATVVLGAVLVLLLVGGGGAAATVQHNQSQDRKQANKRADDAASHKRARDRAQRQAAQEAAQTQQDAQDESDRLKRAARRELVQELRASITKDARGSVIDDMLVGPIYGTSCEPVGGGNVSNLDATTGRYECLAINEKHDDGSSEGYRFTATVNYETFTYTWRLGGS
jgi:hypothetical protein